MFHIATKESVRFMIINQLNNNKSMLCGLRNSVVTLLSQRYDEPLTSANPFT